MVSDSFDTISTELYALLAWRYKTRVSLATDVSGKSVRSQSQPTQEK